MLHERLGAVLPELADTYEIIFVDDGNTEGRGNAFRS